MEANIATMTQAEKVLLRYNYVLAQTGMAQGDFQRTQGTWANQIRILRQQFEALGAIIGQNFIYALKPVVTALNTVMAKLIQFARVVSNSLGKIFGWKYEDTTGGIADDLESGAEAAEDLGGGLGGAADKAKKLKQQLQGFDELNVLNTNTPSSGGGGGGGALGDTDVSATGGQWVRDNTEKFFESDLDSLYKLGDYIGTTLTNQLRSIDWNKVYEGARNFGSGLASFLNGLISVDLFSATGATIAGALNTAIYTALSFGQTFDFYDLGDSIAESVNEFFDEFDFKAFADTIDVWVDGIWDTIITTVGEIEWKDVLNGLGDFFSSLDADTIIQLLGLKLFSGTLKGVFSTNILSALTTGTTTALASAGSSAMVTTSITSFAGKFVAGLVGGIGAALGGFKFGNLIYEWVTGDDTSDIDWASYFVGPDKASFEEWGSAMAHWVNDAFGLELDLFGNTEDADFAKQQEKEKRTATIEKAGLTPTGSTLIDKQLEQQAIAINLQKAFDGIGEDAGESISKISKTLNILGVDTGKLFKTVTKDVSKTLKGMKDGSIDVVDEISNNLSKYGKVILNSFETTGTKTSLTVSTLKDNLLNYFNEIGNGTSESTETTTSNVWNAYSNLKNGVVSSVSGMAMSSISAFNTMETQGVSSVSALEVATQNKTQSMASKVLSNVATMSSSSQTETAGMARKMLERFNDVKDGGVSIFSTLPNTVTSYMASSKGIIDAQNWTGSGINLVNGLINGITSKWGNGWVGGASTLVSKVINLAKNLTDALKNAFDIHSPSRLWEDEIGFNLTEGLRLGVIGEEGKLVDSVVSMGERLTNSFNGSLTLATPSTSLGGNYNFGVTSTMAHQFTADTSMISNIADGVRLGLSSSQAEQNALLREQNELLVQILEKDTGISQQDIFDAVRRENRQRYNVTGTNQLVY